MSALNEAHDLSSFKWALSSSTPVDVQEQQEDEEAIEDLVVRMHIHIIFPCYFLRDTVSHIGCDTQIKYPKQVMILMRAIDMAVLRNF